MTEPELTTSDGDEPMEIVRDTTFSRFVADDAIITNVGRDLEVGFVQFGPMYGMRTDHGEYEQVETKRVMTEVARMRISFPAMVNIMINFLQTGIEEGRLKGEAVSKSLEKWTAEAALSNKQDK